MDQEERLKEALADRFLIEREIGSGGMATVYLAQDLKHDRKVAIKVLNPEFAAAVGTDRTWLRFGLPPTSPIPTSFPCMTRVRPTVFCST